MPNPCDAGWVGIVDDHQSMREARLDLGRGGIKGWSRVINGGDPTTSDSFRINDSPAIDHIYTAWPSWMLNVRVEG